VTSRFGDVHCRTLFEVEDAASVSVRLSSRVDWVVNVTVNPTAFWELDESATARKRPRRDRSSSLRAPPFS